jgi:hypothetical protein
MQALVSLVGMQTERLGFQRGVPRVFPYPAPQAGGGRGIYPEPCAS